jgi:hypothetical protein
MPKMRRYAVQHLPVKRGFWKTRAQEPFPKSEPLRNRYQGMRLFVIAGTGYPPILQEKG